uniref:Peptidase S74 domain-containing protein n=1 Tax=viral metagenome TaxID=1070528 RepID=A0A6C0L7S9_9ZZZZ
MASLIQLSDSNVRAYISSPFFAQLQTIRDIGGTRNTSNTITISKVGGTFSDGTTVKTIDTPYTTLTVNPSTGGIAHAFPFTYNQEVSTTSITVTGSMNIFGTSKIFDTLVASNISSSGFFDAPSIQVGVLSPIILPNMVSTVQNLGQFYTSSVHIPVEKLQSNDYTFNTDLVNTVATLPYFSTYSLQSTIEGLGTFGYISRSQVTSIVTGVGSNYISKSNLVSTVNGLGTSGYVSSADFLSTFSNYQNGLIYGATYTSTVAGLGTSGYISSPALLSTVRGLATFGYISTSWLVSSTQSFQSNIGGAAATALYISTAEGLGKTYVSTAHITSTCDGLLTSNTSILTSTVAGLGSAGYISTTQIISTLNNLGSLGYISTPELTVAVQGTFTAAYSNSFGSTSANLGSLPFSYISTPQMVDSVTGLLTLQSNTLLSTVAGMGQKYVSIDRFVSTAQSLGSLPYSYMSTSYLVPTVAAFLVLPYSSLQLTSTVQGLGSLSYVSAASLATTFQNIGGDYISTPYLATNIPTLTYMKQADLTTSYNSQQTSYSNLLSSNLVSTVQNLGSLGYISTNTNTSAILTSTSIGVANTLAGSNPSQSISTLSITGSDTQLFKYLNGSIQPSASLTVTTIVNTQNLYTTCNLTATNFYASYNGQNGKYFADGTQLGSSSDRRLKKDIVAMSNALEKINSLTGIYFTWKDDPTHKRNVGFLAQDVEQVFPDLVFTGDGDDKMKSVKYESLHVAILEAIKELDAELDSLIH